MNRAQTVLAASCRQPSTHPQGPLAAPPSGAQETGGSLSREIGLWTQGQGRLCTAEDGGDAVQEQGG